MATKEKQKDVPAEGTFKVKKKAKNLGKKTPTITKVSLNSPKEETNAVQESEPKKDVQPVSEQSKEERKETKVELQEVGEPHTEKPDTTQKTEEKVTVINEVKKPKEEIKKQPPTTPTINMPENIQKLVNFMNETGGNIKDYINLNTSFDEVEDNIVVKEYYKRTRPHLNDEEVNFIMDDKFSFDEEVDEERFVKKQKLAFKEEIAKARGFLDDMKSKYYEEIKLRPSVTNEQKKATEFFNRYNQEQSDIADRRNVFVQSTENFFQNEFEGFNFEVGDKKFKYKVSNPFEIAKKQTDISQFVNSFMDDKGNITDYSGYHKAMYAARNADTIAQHFYDQGMADATKDIMKKSKNIDKTPRSGDQGEILPNGWRVRSLSDGVDSTRLKIKKKTKN
jgi:hypothetical protein